MEKQFKKKITWVIKSFSSLQSVKIYSDHFIVNGCKWRLIAYPKGSEDADHLSMFLEVANYGTLPSGWRRHAKYSFTIVNQLSDKVSRQCVNESQKWFDHTSTTWGRRSMFPLKELHAKDSGFLVNGELKIVVVIDVLEVVGKLDISDETSTILETVDVNGFQLLPSQVRFVSLMFERHAEFASELRPKNPILRTAYMSFLLSLIETMCQPSQQKLSNDDMSEAYAALGSMTEAGFNLDWLGKKLDGMSERKEKEHVSETRVQGMEEELKEMKQKCSEMETLVEKELKEMKQKCSEMEALVEKEKEQVLASKVLLSFDDMV